MQTLTSGIQVTGLRETLRALNDRAARAKDIRPVQEKVRTVFLKSEKRLFDAQKFIPLTAETIERKTRQGYPTDRIEVQTGALEKSLTKRRAKGTLNRAKKDQFRFGSNLYYGAFQQGTQHQLPRDMIALSQRDRDRIQNIFGAWVNRGQGAGQQ